MIVDDFTYWGWLIVVSMFCIAGLLAWILEHRNE